MESPLIEFKDVTKRFDGRTVLDGVNLQIFENQITTIIGKSGTGKSVLLKHIIGLLSPDSGTILFEGTPLNTMKKSEWDRYRGKISYMFQNNALFDSMTVFDNVALPLRQTTNLGTSEIHRRVMTRLGQTELAECVNIYPSELSGGMQKRVALARALITDPKVILFDEPTTGQDPIRRNVILSMIVEQRKKFGFTAVLISHDIPDIYFISDRILLLWEGRVAFQGSYQELAGFDHPMIKEFLRSIEGLQDELTGLLSKQVFRSRYAMTWSQGQPGRRMVGILFSIELERLADTFGASAALEVLKALSEYINAHLGAVGGFSARHGRDETLTVLPYVTMTEA
ncbi:MAG TPA: ATP-binding cassette domain-containing protein, partial [Dissulfurispiraceae bacterium]|nr:ATP-binding cassette domain-containing protein [Dissulfurispiraceae bacterium]